MIADLDPTLVELARKVWFYCSPPRNGTNEWCADPHPCKLHGNIARALAEERDRALEACAVHVENNVWDAIESDVIAKQIRALKRGGKP